MRKVLPSIDTILVKTQFLVYNTQFLNHLGLVKVVIYDLMKHHFDYSQYPGISYDIKKDTLADKIDYENRRIDLVKDLEECCREFNTKLAASFARLRIEKQASGDTPLEQMLNILPDEVKRKEELAAEIPKTFRMNGVSLEQIENEFKIRDIPYQWETTIEDAEYLFCRMV